ncbi:dehydrogenase [Agrilactobacillus composti DSM 18527 = JCM 14202]|uniref:Dehydrogenase n=1 Tax=Agrilactobacillus composti DSM 18527 = JCM 14202 TaxID=1423734 RepID=X0PIE3_9LACO|nr:NAD-dependent epimerase/dehydratase family protein [Agrilactobacillus composti]KRM32716.1 dehydrogenase [Agrilactobacillus composti DSM 18527 = JCM 14202]GAF41863.1 hypothetical protein JCM14202_3825 [Agrilactobacillus composti DSM 18527 = JCM 14202]
MSKKIIVTGGTGFVASWVLYEFLNQGYDVATSLRDLTKQTQVLAELKPLLTPAQLNQLTFFEADLTSAENWAAAMAGAVGVIHVASPLGHGTESTAEMVAIAKNGTLNVLQAAHRAGVQRVVMTSSQAASTPTRDSRATLDESFWSDLNNPDLDPYRISKIEAEKAAWQFAKTHDLALTTILPGAIFGPVLSPKNLSSNGILLQLLKGMPLIPQVPLEISDVRNLATLHRLAFENPKAIGKRYLAASQTLTMPEVAQIYKQAFPTLKLKVRKMPNWLPPLLAKFIPAMRSLVPMLNRQYHHTTQAAATDLGLTQYPPETTVLDAAEKLLAYHLVS